MSTNVAPSQHASIVSYVADVLELGHLLPRAKREAGIKRMLVLLTENPTWGIAQLEAHCVERIKATSRTADQFSPEEKAARRAACLAAEERERRNPTPWQAVGTCEKCGGNGIWWRKGPAEDGKAPQLIPDTCYPCAGKGHMTLEDVKRTTNYYAYFYRVPSM